MKNYSHLLTDEQRDIQLMVRDFADKEIIPTAKNYEIDGTFPRELYRKAFEASLRKSQ